MDGILQRDSTSAYLLSRYTRCSSVQVRYSEVWKRGRIPHNTEEFGCFRVLSVAVAIPLVTSRGFRFKPLLNSHGNLGYRPTKSVDERLFRATLRQHEYQKSSLFTTNVQQPDVKKTLKYQRKTVVTTTDPSACFDSQGGRTSSSPPASSRRTAGSRPGYGWPP